eukprot:scaffold51_cov172-Ochromonas_danica.AAC.8
MELCGTHGAARQNPSQRRRGKKEQVKGPSSPVKSMLKVFTTSLRTTRFVRNLATESKYQCRIPPPPPEPRKDKLRLVTCTVVMAIVIGLFMLPKTDDEDPLDFSTLFNIPAPVDPAAAASSTPSEPASSSPAKEKGK